MTVDLAPIVLFVYNRPEHTRQTLEALAQNELASESVLYIYADGPKENANEEVISLISETREVVKSKNWCKEVHVIESSSNKGLADSIVHGVTEIVNRHGKIIVLEDDIVTSKGFLKYMNDALSFYENEEKVMHVSGYMYPIDDNFQDGIVFLKMLSCWGWGTWKRAWDHYSDDVEAFMLKLNNKAEIDKFNVGGNANFYVQLFDNYIGKRKTWAVRWYASWYFRGGFSLFPQVSLVRNIGHDGSGINSVNFGLYDSKLFAQSINVSKHQNIEEDKATIQKLDTFFEAERAIFEGRSFQKQKKPLSKFGKKINELAVRIVNSLLYRYDRFYGEESFFRKTNRIFNASTRGENVVLEKPFFVNHSEIGAYTYIAENARIQFTSIGKFCSIGPNLTCGYGIHPTNGLSTSPVFYSTRSQVGITFSKTDKILEFKPIEIGNDVFIGMNVSILDGVKIGDGAVIGAGTVVSKDVPPYTIAVGAPMKFIRKRFTDEQIKALLEIKWWDFEEDKLKDVESMFFDIDEFLTKYKK